MICLGQYRASPSKGVGRWEGTSRADYEQRVAEKRSGRIIPQVRTGQRVVNKSAATLVGYAH
eukprot:3941961-Rhodomonas_salina.6